MFISTYSINEPFFFPGGEEACLLIHGFTGSPGEMIPMGEFLNKCGYSVLGVRLKGHGTSPEDMARTRWPDWLESCEEGYHELKEKCRVIYTIGFSMGGILAINLALHHEMAGVVAISSPIYIMNRKLFLLPVLKFFKKYEDKKNNKSFYEKEMEKYLSGYDKTPLVCVQSLLTLISLTKKKLNSFNKPILVIQSKGDRTVNYRSARYIYDNVKSDNKRLYWLERSGHMVILGEERERVFDEIRKFLKSLKEAYNK